MDREEFINILNQDLTISAAKMYINRLRYWFDSLQHAPLENYITIEDIIAIHTLFIDKDFADKPRDEQFEISDAILGARGFIRYHSGTNRVVYRSLVDDTILLKVALDEQGIQDNDDECRTQHILKPFVPKVFEITPCGTIQMVEKVQPIRNRKEFYDIGEEVYGILYSFSQMGLILEDIGTNFFMNWGVRRGFGPVLLDFPYVYKRNPSKCLCVEIDKQTGERCNGIIQYDEGMNTLTCQTCGKRYAAKDVGDAIDFRPQSMSSLIEEYGNLKTQNIFDKAIIIKHTESGKEIKTRPESKVIETDTLKNIKNHKEDHIEKKVKKKVINRPKVKTRLVDEF